MVQGQLLQADVFVYTADGEIQGFIGLADNYIAGIFVDEKYRSLEIGKKFLDHVKSKYDSLSLGVYRKNRRTAAFESPGCFCESPAQCGEEPWLSRRPFSQSIKQPPASRCLW